MRLLALDTSLDACAVAVMEGDTLLAWRSEPMQRGHQERLALLVVEAMSAAGLGFADLDRIAATIGPGSFTGVRVGLAFAKTLALALEIPCVGVGTLEALAAAGSTAAAPAAAVLDARRGQLYLQAFGADGHALAPPEAIGVEAAADRLSQLGFPDSGRLVGPGAHLIARPTPAGLQAIAPGSVEVEGVDVRVVARLALARTPRSGVLRPLYLRAPDAKTLAERQAPA